MAIHLTMSARTLARSRFAISPVTEVLGAVQARGRHPARHARAWYRAAVRRMDPGRLAVLRALVPDDHPHTPDFLVPTPAGTVETIEAVAARIASTPEDLVSYHLDIGIRGRTVWPHVAALFDSPDAYEAWRRPAPPELARLTALGPGAVAERAAQAVTDFYDVSVGATWPEVRAVLDADIEHRGSVMAARGAEALLAGLGDSLTWTGTEVRIDRPFEGSVDWADDGILFVPSTTHVGPVRFAAEEPLTPIVFYRARGIARLWERPAPTGYEANLAGLIGETRAVLLLHLATARTTHQLSRETGWSEGTISYHLGILLRSGMVTRSRRGRHVHYRRTALGTALTVTTDDASRHAG